MQHDERWRKLVLASRTFADIAHAQDDLSAMDSLRRNVLVAQKTKLFAGLVDVARYLSSEEVARDLAKQEAAGVLVAAGLDMSTVNAARTHAKRFLDQTGPSG